MKYALAIIIALPLLLGCGHLVGNNPEGVTGGGSNGYGSFGTTFIPNNLPYQILGVWRQDVSPDSYSIVTFRNNGMVTVASYVGDSQQTATGGYLLSADRLNVNVDGWKNGSGTIQFDGNSMSVAFDDGTIILNRAE